MIEVSIGVQDTMFLNPEHISSISRLSPTSCMVVMTNGREYQIRETKESLRQYMIKHQEAQLMRNQSILNKVTP